MALNIGLYVIEVDGTAPVAIAGAATSVAGFAITTQRGAPNQPVRVTSFPQFIERFGGFSVSSLGAYLVKGFFDSGGQFARAGPRGPAHKCAGFPTETGRCSLSRPPPGRW